jgi:membrane-bound serine protease (ClpP class)
MTPSIPGSTEFLKNAIDKANQADSCLIVIQLDTPGGVVDSMRHMVQAIMKSRSPVAVFVAPAGARATSAGAFIVLSASVAAMAPATHMGAASPVQGGGKEIEGTMAKKVMSDLTALIRSMAKRKKLDPKLAEDMVTEATSYDASKAKELGLVDLVTPDLGNLLKQLEGRVVPTGDGKRTISTKGKTLVFHEPGFREKLLSALANPNLAYILMMIGLAGLYFELSNPGAIFPGVVGAVSLILAFFGMSALPVSYAGLALIGLAIVLFIAEIKNHPTACSAWAGPYP